jgi:hypothetical protein
MYMSYKVILLYRCILISDFQVGIPIAIFIGIYFPNTSTNSNLDSYGNLYRNLFP